MGVSAVLTRSFRIIAVSVVVCTLPCWLLAAELPVNGPPHRPSVVFILADQWRAQATGYAGDPNARTPASIGYRPKAWS